MQSFKFEGAEFTPFAAEQAGVFIHTRFEREERGFTVRISVENTGREELPLGKLPLFAKVRLNGRYEKTYSECRELLGELGINDSNVPRASYNLLGFTDAEGSRAVLFGFDNLKDFYYNFISEPAGDGFDVSVLCDFQGACLGAGQKTELSDLKVYFSRSISDLLDVHARNILQKMPLQKQVKNTFGTGWCSWYYYYGTENKADIYENMQELQSAQTGKEMGFFLIDDGWNQKEKNVCVWGDWTAGFKFPEGMRAVSDRIHASGLRSGLWLAPFAVSRNSTLFAEHPDWMLGGDEKILNPNEGVFGLDLTRPDVLEYIRETFTRVFDEWGFDLVKIDFLLYGAGEGSRFDRRSTGVQAFRKGMEVIRECAKGKAILNCGSPVLQSVGLCDAMRIGSDVGSRWYFPLNEACWPYGNCSIKCSTRYVAYRNWMNSIFWVNDPDCIVVRDKSNGIEQERFCSFFPYMDIREEDFGLTDSEADLWVKMVAFTGGLKYLSEKWSELPERRRELVRKYMQKQYGACKLVDEYRFCDLYVFKSREGNKVAVFNVSDEDVALVMPAEKLQNAEALRESDSGCPIVREGDTYKFPPIRARSGYIFE